MALECGIVGLPNVGKSTLFNAITNAENAQAANYPFCTIDPNVGVVDLPDQRLQKIADKIQPQKILPATVSFVDIAGLVKGASKGEGLGNQFLGNIKNCHAIAHVVRCFVDDDVVHVSGTVDPLGDVEVIETELMLADLSTLEKREERLQKLIKSGTPKAKEQLAFVLELKEKLESGQPARSLDSSRDEWQYVQDLHLITQKPVLYVANVDENTFSQGSLDDNAHYKALKDFAQKQGAEVVPVSAKIESELVGMSLEEKKEFLESLGVEEPGLNKLIRSVFGLLGLQSYFTAGPQEVRAWTIEKGWTAPQAAGVIHGDFERGFICAETYHFEDLEEHGSEQKVKEAGLVRTEGKSYVVKDGDIMHFRLTFSAKKLQANFYEGQWVFHYNSKNYRFARKETLRGSPLVSLQEIAKRFRLKLETNDSYTDFALLNTKRSLKILFSSRHNKVIGFWGNSELSRKPLKRKKDLFLPLDFGDRALRPLLTGEAPPDKNAHLKYVSQADVVIDPGHGGNDWGAQFLWKGRELIEKNLSLSFSKKLVRALEKKGISAVATRWNDVYLTLPERSALAQRFKARLFLSLHFNYDPQMKQRGHEIYLLSLGTKDAEALKKVQIENQIIPRYETQGLENALSRMKAETKLEASLEWAKKITPVFSNFVPAASKAIRMAPFYVLWGAEMPSLLLELGYVNHAKDMSFYLDSKKTQELVNALAEVIAKKLGKN